MPISKAEVYEDLRRRIIINELEPLKSLSEKDLMRHYGIGRTPLREILLELQRDGLIQRFPRTGTLVSPMDLHLFRQVVEIRTQLEGFASELAADRITDDQLDAMQNVLRRVAEFQGADSHDLGLLMQCEIDFHNLIYEASHNRKMRDILYELHGISARFWCYLIFGKQAIFNQFEDHQRLLEALRKRDRKAARQIAVDHVQKFVNQVKDHVLI